MSWIRTVTPWDFRGQLACFKAVLSFAPCKGHYGEKKKKIMFGEVIAFWPVSKPPSQP